VRTVHFFQGLPHYGIDNILRNALKKHCSSKQGSKQGMTMELSKKYSPTLLVLAFTATSAQARTWQSLIDREILVSSIQDSARQQLRIEQDPFLTFEEVMQPTPAPQAEWITMAPTHSPSNVPSDMPSLYPTSPTPAPSEREANVDGNGGCNEGTMLYQVNMYDSWGDGWDNTMLSITGLEDGEPLPNHGNMITRTQTTDTGDAIVTYSETVALDGTNLFDETNASAIDPLGLVFQGGLRRGFHATADVCLMPRRCYEILVQGGDMLSEVSWDIRPIVLGADNTVPSATESLVDGGAPSYCQFSLPGENFDGFCPTTCSSTLNPEHTETPRLYESLHVSTTPPEEEGTSVPTDADTSEGTADGTSTGTGDGTVTPSDDPIARSSNTDPRGIGFRNGQFFLNYLRDGGGERKK
jgi:hypothetical protein